MTCSRDELIFDHSIVLTSVTEDYDLTCDHSIVRSIFNSLYMGGMLLGNNKAYVYCQVYYSIIIFLKIAANHEEQEI